MPLILIKSLALTFYRKHLGLFFVVGYLFFGLIRAQEHIRIAEFMADTPVLLFLPCLLSLLYALLIALHFNALRKEKAYLFLKSIPLLNKKTQYKSTTAAIGMALTPVFSYAAFISRYQINAMQWDMVLLIFFFCIGLTFCLVRYFLFTSRQNLPEKVQFGPAFVSFATFQKHWLSWSFLHIITKESLGFWLTKLLSTTLLFAVLLLFPTGTYDLRLLLLGVLFSAQAHMVVVLEKNTFYHNLKFSITQHEISFLATALESILFFTCTVLFEVFLVFYWLPSGVSFQEAIELIFFLLSLLLFLEGYQQKFKASLDEFLKFSFYFGAINFLLIMFSTPNIVLIGLYWSIALGLKWKRNWFMTETSST